MWSWGFQGQRILQTVHIILCTVSGALRLTFWLPFCWLLWQIMHAVYLLPCKGMQAWCHSPVALSLCQQSSAALHLISASCDQTAPVPCFACHNICIIAHPCMSIAQPCP